MDGPQPISHRHADFQSGFRVFVNHYFRFFGFK